MDEIAKLHVKISADNTEANAGIDETTEKAEKSGNKISASLSKIGSAIGTVAKLGAKGVTAIAGGLSFLAKQSMAAYADYEQLTGGVETLFNKTDLSLQEYADSVGKTTTEVFYEWSQLTAGGKKVMEDAQAAFMTAGLSTNQYMETVTSFSASLLQSLAGDTKAAAEMSNLAVIDMADNANKMGTSMDSIQSAYQGFAKQNYTMLDNLKLGYGGTKDEMERLLRDAMNLDKSFQLVTDDNDKLVYGFADIVQAIHIVQEEMGITGTTAKEASSTIQGSIGMLKASWENFLGGMADDSQDFDALLENLVNSAMTVVGNIAPRIMKLLPRLVQGLSQLAQNLAPYIPDLLAELIPAAIETLRVILTNVVDIVPDILDTVLPGIGGRIGKMVTGLITSLGGIIERILPSILYIVEAILPILLDALDLVVPILFNIIEDILPILLNLIKLLIPYVRDIIEGILPILLNVINQLLPPLMSIIDAILPLLQSLLDALVPAIFQILEVLSPIIDLVLALIVPILNLVASAIDPLTGVLVTLIDTALAIIMPILQIAVDLIGRLLTPIIEALTPILGTLLDALMPLIESFAVLLQEILKPIMPILMEVANIITGVLAKAIENAIPYLDQFIGVFESIISFVTNVFKGNWEDAWNDILDVFVGIINLFPGAIELVVNGAINVINGLIKGVNKITTAIGIEAIPEIPDVSIPRIPELAKGGVLEKGQVGLLEGDGAEAVVPLEQNREWISRVSEEMQVQGIGGDKESVGLLRQILSTLQEMRENGENLPDALTDAIAESLTFSINNREFARLVKSVG